MEPQGAAPPAPRWRPLVDPLAEDGDDASNSDERGKVFEAHASVSSLWPSTLFAISHRFTRSAHRLRPPLIATVIARKFPWSARGVSYRIVQYQAASLEPCSGMAASSGCSSRRGPSASPAARYFARPVSWIGPRPLYRLPSPG